MLIQKTPSCVSWETLYSPCSTSSRSSFTLFGRITYIFYAINGQRYVSLLFLADEKKLDEVYLETEKNRQMLSQILLRTVNNQSFGLSSKRIDPQVGLFRGIRKFLTS